MEYQNSGPSGTLIIAKESRYSLGERRKWVKKDRLESCKLSLALY